MTEIGQYPKHFQQKCPENWSKYQILDLQASERGCLTEIITCNNEIDHYMPLQITFLWKNMKLKLKTRASSSSIYTCQPSGQISLHRDPATSISMWRRPCITHVRHSKKAWNFNAINVGWKHHAVVICLPQHFT
jgi:hypothetical protein